MAHGPLEVVLGVQVLLLCVPGHILSCALRHIIFKVSFCISTLLEQQCQRIYHYKAALVPR